ncbi:MAG: hypothetical protein JWQ38_773 [Flavipsychrobacter sp.]|nr:hypothetical protein [Flavipsychrobacter sp.]
MNYDQAREKTVLVKNSKSVSVYAAKLTSFL